MTAARAHRRRRRLVPEVVQTSAMDCGPAALAALLAGCGVAVSYPRLRELCQTDVDGTSIDTLEELACQLGLDAEQVMLPLDAILDDEHGALPCIAVTRLPSGLTHFVVLWGARFGLVQVMDPGSGRRFVTRRQLLDSLYVHAMEVPAADWLAYAGDDEFRDALLARLRRHTDAARARRLVDAALAEGSWEALAAVDALARMAASARQHGTATAAAVGELFADFERDPRALRGLIPAHHHQVTATSDAQTLTLHGAVLLKVSGLAGPGAAAAAAEAPEAPASAGADAAGPSEAPGLQHVRGSRPVDAFAELRRLMRDAGMGNPLPRLAAAGVLVGLLTVIEALLLRFLLDFQVVRDPLLLASLAAVLLLPLAVAALIDRGALGAAYAVGRRLDALLRIRLLERLPRMRDSYFESRLVSDLAERGHAITQLKELPELLISATGTLTRLLAIGIGLVLLAPASAGIVVAMVLVALAAPLLLYPIAAEGDLRARAHLAAVGRLNLDALRGAEAIWSHAARPAVESTGEGLLAEWRRSAFAVLQTITLGETLVVATLTLLAAGLVASNLAAPTLTVGSLLLLAYWSLQLPLVASELFEMLRVAPQFRNILGRVVELFAPAELEDIAGEAGFDGPVGLQFEGVTIERAQRTVLHEVDLTIPAGQHLAVVGASGAGKSSLLDALLGFQRVSAGTLRVDGRSVDPARLARLRERTACISAELYLWNRSIVENLLYGAEVDGGDLDAAVTAAGLRGDLARMRDGLATRVGENGARLSGGEGQRVRLARGLLRAAPVLVLLDEPFRGMDSARRLRLLEAVRRRWPEVTTLFVSHEVSETLGFDRVVVIEDGRIVEDGAPAVLRADANSHYARLLRTEARVDEQLSRDWQRLWLQDGRLEADGGR